MVRLTGRASVQRVKIAMGLGHVARYVVGAALSWLLFPIEAALLYVVLLVAAGMFEMDSGGPLAGPMMIVLGAVLGVGVTLLVTLPALLLGDLLTRRGRWLAAPIVATLCALVLLAAYVGIWSLAVRSPVSEAVITWGALVALSALPLLAFMALTYSSRAALELVARRTA